VNLAIFGGTFDPIHNAHLDVARAARRECFLDRILFVPAGEPPHKPGQKTADYEHRYEMVRLASSDHPSFEPSRLEEPGRDQGQSYAIFTIHRVAAQLTRHDRLFFLIGADAFREVTSWYHWRRVVKEVEFIVVNRPGFAVDEALVPEGARIHVLRSVNSPLSSTEIRRRLEAGQSIRGLVPPAVARYISKHQLYRPPPPRPRRRPVKAKVKAKAQVKARAKVKPKVRAKVKAKVTRSKPPRRK
jgi:nicotinate-nucleotide adenylyltransferase